MACGFGFAIIRERDLVFATERGHFQKSNDVIGGNWNWNERAMALVAALELAKLC
jgi:hypothetical protein